MRLVRALAFMAAALLILAVLPTLRRKRDEVIVEG